VIIEGSVITETGAKQAIGNVSLITGGSIWRTMGAGDLSVQNLSPAAPQWQSP